MVTTTFPLRGQFRADALLEAVRAMNTATMTTPEVVEACPAAVPDAAPGEIITALRQVGEEELREAAQLQAAFRSR